MAIIQIQAATSVLNPNNSNTPVDFAVRPTVLGAALTSGSNQTSPTLATSSSTLPNVSGTPTFSKVFLYTNNSRGTLVATIAATPASATGGYCQIPIVMPSRTTNFSVIADLNGAGVSAYDATGSPCTANMVAVASSVNAVVQFFPNGTGQHYVQLRCEYDLV